MNQKALKGSMIFRLIGSQRAQNGSTGLIGAQFKKKKNCNPLGALRGIGNGSKDNQVR